MPLPVATIRREANGFAEHDGARSGGKPQQH